MKPDGTAPVDYSIKQGWVVLLHLLHLDWMHSHPGERAPIFCDGHVRVWEMRDTCPQLRLQSQGPKEEQALPLLCVVPHRHQPHN